MPAWPPPTPVWQPAPNSTNGLAVASLICGIGQMFSLGLTGIPAIILGHTALRQIRRTGEQGETIATLGVAMGWIGTTLLALGILLMVILASGPGPGW